jgi:hypothetical protein
VRVAGYLAALLWLAAGSTAAASTAGPADGRFDDAKFCTDALSAGKPALPADSHRRCMIAIANTYLDAEQATASADGMATTDDVSRHLLGTQPDFQAGNRARLIWEMRQSTVKALDNRDWVVDGDQVWVIYDGYLKTNPMPVHFPMGERITVDKGLVKEIILLVPDGVQ